MSVGTSIVTVGGIHALAAASASGLSIKPKYFKFSSQDIAINPELDKNDINGWITKDISLYQTIDDMTIEFVCDVNANDASNYTRIAGLYLDDGTLFMVAKPPYPFPPSLRQTFKIQMVYQNATGLVNFQYIPWDEEQQSLSILETSMSLGMQIMENAQTIGFVKSKLINQK